MSLGPPKKSAGAAKSARAPSAPPAKTTSYANAVQNGKGKNAKGKGKGKGKGKTKEDPTKVRFFGECPIQAVDCDGLSAPLDLYTESADRAAFPEGPQLNGCAMVASETKAKELLVRYEDDAIAHPAVLLVEMKSDRFHENFLAEFTPQWLRRYTPQLVTLDVYSTDEPNFVHPLEFAMLQLGRPTAWVCRTEAPLPIKVNTPVGATTPMIFFLLNREDAISDKLFQGMRDNQNAFVQHIRKHMGNKVVPEKAVIHKMSKNHQK